MLNALLGFVNNNRWEAMIQDVPAKQQLVATLGLTDLALSTEARYTRHPSISDPLAAYMDHPGAIEHFPSGSFILPIAQMDN